MTQNNINECLTDANCIGTVENVDTRKVVVGVENEAVLNTLKINIESFIQNMPLMRLTMSTQSQKQRLLISLIEVLNLLTHLKLPFHTIQKIQKVQRDTLSPFVF